MNKETRKHCWGREKRSNREYNTGSRKLCSHFNVLVLKQILTSFYCLHLPVPLVVYCNCIVNGKANIPFTNDVFLSLSFKIVSHMFILTAFSRMQFPSKSLIVCLAHTFVGSTLKDSIFFQSS